MYNNNIHIKQQTYSVKLQLKTLQIHTKHQKSHITLNTNQICKFPTAAKNTALKIALFIYHSITKALFIK